MKTVLRHRETTQGSFEAWGTGFRYNYNNKKRALTVFHRNSERLLAQFKLDRLLSKHPLAYVELLEKACQINALMVSNNATVNLADTMELRYISPIIHSVGDLSRHAFDLQSLSLKRFGEMFSEEFDLKSVKIKLFEPKDDTPAFFIARMQTHHENGFCVRSCSLPGLMAAMSDRTVRDLITMEFGHRFEGSAHNLLNASSKLSSLSLILDDDFVPKQKISYKNEEKNGFTHIKSSH